MDGPFQVVRDIDVLEEAPNARPPVWDVDDLTKRDLIQGMISWASGISLEI